MLRLSMKKKIYATKKKQVSRHGGENWALFGREAKLDIKLKRERDKTQRRGKELALDRNCCHVTKGNYTTAHIRGYSTPPISLSLSFASLALCFCFIMSFSFLFARTQTVVGGTFCFRFCAFFLCIQDCGLFLTTLLYARFFIFYFLL